jgi:hypothetical protein
MRMTTIALAIACVIPSSFAFAQGGMHFGNTHRFTNPVGTARIATRPRNISGNTLGPIAHDPSGSTITGAAMKRTPG